VFEMPDTEQVREIVALSLAEDLGVPTEVFALGAPADPTLLARDATSHAVLPEDAWFEGRVVARAAGVVAGLPLLDDVWSAISAAAGLFDPIDVFPLVAEGSRVEAGTAVADVSGLASAVLAGERTALDFLIVLSGIATRAAEWQGAAGESLQVVDTRKTYPGLRALSKYAVEVGGAHPHRRGLYDMVLVKDNHLRRAGGIAAAVRSARERAAGLLVEIEADTVAQAGEAAAAGADIVLLDNMDDATVAEAIAAVREAAAASTRKRPVLVEVSGGVTIDRLPALAALGVDRVSTSALGLAPPLDFALDEGASVTAAASGEDASR
jgi:nicotinate-nucleotide pyrophosphorylase (carboxylating)